MITVLHVNDIELTIDYELEKIRQGKAGEIQSAESKLLEELINEQSSRLRPGEVEGQVRTGNVTPDNSAGGDWGFHHNGHRSGAVRVERRPYSKAQDQLT